MRSQPQIQSLTVADLRIIALEGDETGQELLEHALRVLDSSVTGMDADIERFDLSLANRRETSNEVVRDAARAMREARFGIKAPTVTPEGADDVGSPNRILREEVDGKVIIRTGRRIPGVTPVAGVHHPIAVCRMAVGDAYGAEQWRERSDGEETACRTERITRTVCRSVAEYSFRAAERLDALVYGGPKWTVSPVYEGMLKEELDAAAERHRDVPYEPVLIDATYAGLVSGGPDTALVIPALNRDGDCLSDLVMPLYGSIAGAESVLLSFDEDYEIQTVMAEAPHGTAPAMLGKDIANPMAMILAGAALLHYAAEVGSREDGAESEGSDGTPVVDRDTAHAADRTSRAMYESVFETTAAGTRTPDLGGHASTSEFTDAVIDRVRGKLEAWSSSGGR
jgi:isocitrate dehydrogenase (NAD+)